MAIYLIIVVLFFILSTFIWCFYQFQKQLNQSKEKFLKRYQEKAEVIILDFQHQIREIREERNNHIELILGEQNKENNKIEFKYVGSINELDEK
mgnify:CR=1 FL=1